MRNVDRLITYGLKIAIIATPLIIFPVNTFAQLGDVTAPSATIVDVNFVTSTFLNFAIGSGVLVFFLIFCWACIQWITSAGDKMKLDQAKARITAAVIGLLILGSVFAIFQLVRALTYDPVTSGAPAVTPTPLPGGGTSCPPGSTDPRCMGGI